jgi:hypothetical protein
VVAIVSVVIVIVPVALRAPTMFIFIPPTMAVIPTILARLAQLVPCMVRLAALPSMVFDSFMKAMIRPGDAPLALVLVRAQTGRAGEQQKSRQCRTGQCDLGRSKNSPLMFYLHPVPLLDLKESPWAGSDESNRKLRQGI